MTHKKHTHRILPTSGPKPGSQQPVATQDPTEAAREIAAKGKIKQSWATQLRKMFDDPGKPMKDEKTWEEVAKHGGVTIAKLHKSRHRARLEI